MGSGTEWMGFFPGVSFRPFLSFFSGWSFVLPPTPLEFPFPCAASSAETGTRIASVNISTPSRFTSLMFVFRFKYLAILLGLQAMSHQYLASTMRCLLR